MFNEKDIRDYFYNRFDREIEEIIDYINYFKDYVVVIDLDNLRLLWHDKYETSDWLSIELLRFFIISDYRMTAKLYKDERKIFIKIIKKCGKTAIEKIFK